jgi:hypothetical protein
METMVTSGSVLCRLPRRLFLLPLSLREGSSEEYGPIKLPHTMCLIGAERTIRRLANEPQERWWLAANLHYRVREQHFWQKVAGRVSERVELSGWRARWKAPSPFPPPA